MRYPCAIVPPNGVCLRALDVDVDALVVAGDVGEGVDVGLGHFVTVGGAEGLALGGLELIESR